MRHLFDCVASMSNLQQLSWVVTDEILGASEDSQLPLESNGDSESERKETVSVDDLQNLLRQRLAHTSVQILRLPEYATHRYGLSVTQED